MPAEIKSAKSTTSETTKVVSVSRPTETFDEFVERFGKTEIRARYKIEVTFSRHRSSLLHKPSPLMVVIWESGRKFHGGGDQKMYWCGYDDCDRPISSDNFAAFHCVCPHCHRELFLDETSKVQHKVSLWREGKDYRDLNKVETVYGEKLANLTPPKLAELLEKLWHRLDGDADIYLKYSPYEIRYDAVHKNDNRIRDDLDKVRIQRQPLIYPLKNIIKDLHAGADLRGRFTAMITS